MPKITIREIDKTTIAGTAQSTTAVAVLGPNINGFKSGRYLTYNSFVNALESLESGVEVPYEDLGVELAGEILKQGLPIIYVSCYDISVDEESGAPIKTVAFEDTTGVEAVNAVYKLLEDRGLFGDLRFITVGGLADCDVDLNAGESGEVELKTNVYAYEKAIQCAGNRGDAVALVDKMIGDQSAEAVDEWVNENFEITCNETIDLVKRTGVTFVGNAEIYGTYSAAFAPAFVTTIKLSDKARTKAEAYLPASLAYLSCFGKFHETYANWFAMAGSVRGKSNYTLEPVERYGDAAIDLLQIRSVPEENLSDDSYCHLAVNTLANIDPFGCIVWGSRTMYPISKNTDVNGIEMSELRASSFLNCRQLCIDIKKRLYRAARKFTFEQNNDILWFNFCSAITPLLDNMKANQGIRGYKLVKENTKKKAVLAAKVIITPIEPVEDFDLTVEIRDDIENED